MTKEQVLGLVRHTLTFVGAFLVAKGLASDSMVSELSGAVLTLLSGVWSVVSKDPAE